MSTTGNVIIAVQAALDNGDFRSEDEKQAFCQHLVKTVDESFRQKLLTWRNNRIRDENEPRNEPKPETPMLDHHVRERERAAARPSI